MNLKKQMHFHGAVKRILFMMITIMCIQGALASNNKDKNDSEFHPVKLGNINTDYGVTDKEKIKPLIIFDRNKDYPNDTDYETGDVLSFDTEEEMIRFKSKYPWSSTVMGDRNKVIFKHWRLVAGFGTYLSNGSVSGKPENTLITSKTFPRDVPYVAVKANCDGCHVAASSLSDLYIKTRLLNRGSGAYDSEGSRITIEERYSTGNLPKNYWENVEKWAGTYKKGKYNVINRYFGIPNETDGPVFVAFDTQEEAIKYIDDRYISSFKQYQHHHYCVTYCPNEFITPEGYVYYRANYLLTGTKPGAEDVISKGKAKFLSYENEAPKGKYYFKDNLNVRRIYGHASQKQRYYAFESLEEALAELNLTYSTQSPQQWVTKEWLEKAKNATDSVRAKLPPLDFPQYPYKIYLKDRAVDLEWVFGRNSGTLMGPNGKSIVNFYARGTYGYNCTQFSGTTNYPLFAKFLIALWRIPEHKSTPVGESIPYCNDTSDYPEYIQPGLLGQPGFPTSVNVPPLPTPSDINKIFKGNF